MTQRIMKENRALVVLFHGNEIPNNVMERISKEISTWAEANIENIEMYTLNSNELAKLIIPAVVHHNDAKTKCKACDDAIVKLSKYVSFKELPVIFTINISTAVAQALQRINESREVEDDKQLLEAIKILGQGGPRTTKLCNDYCYTSEIDRIIRQIYNRIFDKYGKIKE